ncbi:hypothetical protein NC490_00745 [Streptomyces sp. G1]|nr:hypothetical protein [Streptomyces sp. G1]
MALIVRSCLKAGVTDEATITAWIAQGRPGKTHAPADIRRTIQRQEDKLRRDAEAAAKRSVS